MARIRDIPRGWGPAEPRNILKGLMCQGSLKHFHSEQVDWWYLVIKGTISKLPILKGINLMTVFTEQHRLLSSGEYRGRAHGAQIKQISSTNTQNLC